MTIQCIHDSPTMEGSSVFLLDPDVKGSKNATVEITVLDHVSSHD